ncbi:hypothetical protein, partial [Ursidibacter sp. B-7004-1]
AQQAARDAETATTAEQARARQAAEQAARELAAAQQALKDAQAATAAEQAKAQKAADKAAQDLAAAQVEKERIEGELANKASELQTAIARAELAELSLSKIPKKFDAGEYDSRGYVRNGRDLVPANGSKIGYEFTEEEIQMPYTIGQPSTSNLMNTITYKNFAYNLSDAGYVITQEHTQSPAMVGGGQKLSYSGYYAGNLTKAEVLNHLKGSATYKGVMSHYYYDAHQGRYVADSSGSISGTFYLKANFDDKSISGKMHSNTIGGINLQKTKLEAYGSSIKFSGSADSPREFDSARGIPTNAYQGEYEGLLAGGNAEQVVGKATLTEQIPYDSRQGLKMNIFFVGEQ